MMMEKSGVPAGFRLMLNGKPLKDPSVSLVELGLFENVDGPIVHQVLRLRGGGGVGPENSASAMQMDCISGE